ncbi:MAG: alpha/beta hydrolase [Acidimicrobiales bacterium]
MSEVTVLVVHGFTGSPQSFELQIASFERQGYEVIAPTLPGHDSSPEELAELRYDDFYRSLHARYHELSDRSNLFVMGLSMGGTLLCDLLTKHHEPAGAILVNPLVVPPHESYIAVVEEMLEGGTVFVPGIGSDIKRTDRSERAYDRTPLATARSLFRATELLQGRLGDITTKTLLFSSREDHVVPVESGELLAHVCGDLVDRRVLEESYHVATLDFDAERISEESIEFIETLKL